MTTPDQIAKTFDFCRDNNLDLAQPAVVSDYHIVHQATRWIPGAKMHITDTVEMMADIHSQRTWAECMRHCSELPVGIGYNIEGYWQYVLDCRSGTTKYGGRVAVIDQYPVRHLKPVQDTEQFRQKGWTHGLIVPGLMIVISWLVGLLLPKKSSTGNHFGQFFTLL